MLLHVAAHDPICVATVFVAHLRQYGFAMLDEVENRFGDSSVLVGQHWRHSELGAHPKNATCAPPLHAQLQSITLVQCAPNITK